MQTPEHITRTLDSTLHVGVNISTMEAIQSLFAGHQADPWALDCLANWIDVAVNHERTLYALPKALADLNPNVVFPKVLQIAEQAGLIGPIEDSSAADQISFSKEEILRHYSAFEMWASVHHKMLTEWLDFTTNVRRIQAGRFIDEGPLNIWIRDNFWGGRPAGWLRDQGDKCGLNSDKQQFAFDMIVRAAQYHVAFGNKRTYQPHPLRSLYVPNPELWSLSHSWGRVFIKEIIEGSKEWDIQSLVAKVLEMRERVRENQATAACLHRDTSETRLEKLNQTAVDLGFHILPPSYKEWLRQGAVLAGIPLEIIGHAAGIPFVGVAWEFVQIPLISVAQIGIQHLRCVQRRVEFPGPASDAITVIDVRRKLKRSV